MKIVSDNRLIEVKKSLGTVCLGELTNLIKEQSSLPYECSKSNDLESVILLAKIQALIVYTIDNIKVFQPLISLVVQQDGLPKKREFRIFDFATGKTDQTDFEIHETFLINCVDTVCGPAVSIVLMMYVLGDIDEHIAIAALREAYYMDLTYRRTGWYIQYFKKTAFSSIKLNRLTPFENDCYSMQTATFFQRAFKVFDVTQVKNEEGNYNTEYYVQSLELRPAVIVNELIKAASRYVSTFIKDYYEPFERQRVQDIY